jgi:hypothetical protein
MIQKYLKTRFRIIIAIMNIKIANAKDIIKLKVKSRKLLNTNIGKATFNQRYGKDFTYDELCVSIDNNQSVWTICTPKNVPIGFGEIWQNKDKTTEIGYMIFPEFQKQGFGLALATQMFEDCIQIFNLKNLKIEIENTNIGSTKIVESLAKKCTPSKIETNTKFDPPTIIYSWVF